MHRLNTARISCFSIKRDTLDEEKNQSKHVIGSVKSPGVHPKYWVRTELKQVAIGHANEIHTALRK